MLRSSSATMLTCLVLALFSAGCGGGPPPGKIATATQSNFRTVGFGLYKEARVSLAVKMNTLEEVWVMMP